MSKDISNVLKIFEDLDWSTVTLAVMCDATTRAFKEMYEWHYKDRHEMKLLGSTIFQLEDKFFELFILGISKMVEDFFNDLEIYGGHKLPIWDSSLDSIKYCREVRLIRHVGNVIKHNNSIIETSSGERSANELVNNYGFPDNTPIQYSKFLENPLHDSLLKQLFYANVFCLNLLNIYGSIKMPIPNVIENEIVKFMVERYIHEVPGHPNAKPKEDS